MAKDIHNLLKGLKEFEKSQHGAGMDLRLDFAEIVLRRLRELNWNQKQLADAVEMKEPQLTKLIHSDSNCTVDTIGRLLNALGIRTSLVRQIADEPTSTAICITDNSRYREVISTTRQGAKYGHQEKTSTKPVWIHPSPRFSTDEQNETDAGGGADYAPPEHSPRFVG